MMATPEERTWLELQENLRRVRQRRARQGTRGNYGYKGHGNRKNGALQMHEDHNHYRHRKYSPILPKLNAKGSHSTSSLMRGSYYPVIPPLLADSEHFLNRYGLDSYDQHYDESQLSPSPSDLLSVACYETFQNGHDTKTGSAERYDASPVNAPKAYDRHGDLLYNVQYDTLGHEERKLNRRKKLKYLVLPSRTSPIDLCSDTPDYNYDIWTNRKWDEPKNDGVFVPGKGQDVDSSRKFAWRDPREEQRELANLTEQRKIIELLTHLESSAFASSFFDHFIKEFLEDELILDVACQVLIEEREKVKMSPTKSFQETRVQQNKQAQRKNKSLWLELVYRPDIYSAVATDLVQEAVQEESALVVRGCIKEMVDNYFCQKAVVEEGHAICNEMVQELLPDAVIETMVECFMESLAYDVIDSVVRDVAENFMKEVFATGTLRLPLTKQEKHDQKGEVEKLAYHMLIDGLCLDHFLGIIARNGQTWSDEEYTDRFLDDHIADTLLSQYMSIVNRRKTTAHCIPFKRFHEKLSTEVAIDVILQELEDLLDEDMKDLFEYEVAMDLSIQEEV